MNRFLRPRNILIAMACVALFAVLAIQLNRTLDEPQPTTKISPRRYSYEGGRVTAWWDEVPEEVKRVSRTTGPHSNIRPRDYAGPEACKKCHKQNYELWTQHPHRLMNALAIDENVKGDFSGKASISHLGGKATFFREDGSFRMQLERHGARRKFNITRTIGSRFFQYYVGRQIEGPRAGEQPSYEQDFVLPYGYWLEPQEWVPIVHVYGRDHLPSQKVTDPYDLQSPPLFPAYSGCKNCHTTFPIGDQFIQHLRIVGRHAPLQLHFAMSDYMAESHPELWDPKRNPNDLTKFELLHLVNSLESYSAIEHAVTLGISCEACHLGAKEHAEGRLEKPSFFPRSSHLFVQQPPAEKLEFGRTHANVNWACGRCHAGDRPYYAGGMSTWNSTEYSDAMRGGCYSKLTCVDCHNPHQGIGPKWKLTAAQDDALCLKCHEKFERDEARIAHTHHPMGSSGSRCMNCHMPRINEGLQDMVRSHTIFSPTNPAMIEANEANACNLCHVEKPIDWTLKYLDQWYTANFDEDAIDRNYPARSDSVALDWLRSDNEAVRLTAADALFRNRAKWALEDLIEALDDPFMTNRQFARIGIEELLGIRLVDFGYRFYMTADERREPIDRLRSEFLRSD
jgi:predicted CXXCH cytochrome family protein